MTAAERRQAIIEVLCIRRFDTRENLAEEFHVTPRTITNDVLMLSLSYPIDSTPGKGGGIYVLDGFYLHSFNLKRKHVDLLKRIYADLTGEDRETMCEIIRKVEGGVK